MQLLFSFSADTVSTFGDYIKFMVTMDQNFLRLLYSEDEVSLLLFAIWLSQISTFDLWRMDYRAQTECSSIYA